MANLYFSSVSQSVSMIMCYVRMYCADCFKAVAPKNCSALRMNAWYVATIYFHLISHVKWPPKHLKVTGNDNKNEVTEWYCWSSSSTVKPSLGIWFIVHVSFIYILIPWEHCMWTRMLTKNRSWEVKRIFNYRDNSFSGRHMFNRSTW